MLCVWLLTSAWPDRWDYHCVSIWRIIGEGQEASLQIAAKRELTYDAPTVVRCVLACVSRPREQENVEYFLSTDSED